MADRALLWLDEVIARHGTAEGPGRVRVPLSQAALARATARSAGTISYYLRCLGPLVERRDGTLVVDIAALTERGTQRRQRRTQVAEKLSRRLGSSHGGRLGDRAGQRRRSAECAGDGPGA